MFSLDWFYSFDELRAYSLTTTQGKERLDSVIKHLHELLETAEVKLPERARVLCLMAGSCIEGIAFAQRYGIDVTCLDLRRKITCRRGEGGKTQEANP